MQRNVLVTRFYNKFSFYLGQLLGRDNLTGVNIRRRAGMKEIGTKYGGWVIPGDILDANSICYCVGCGEDISFDLGLISQYGCHVFGFDPTPRAIAYVQAHTAQNSHYHFFPIGLWDKPEVLKFFPPQDPSHVSHSLVNLQKTTDPILVPVDRLKNVMQQHGHSRLDLLKLDIEGAEYRVIESILRDKLDIRVLCVEYDEWFSPLDAAFKQRITTSVTSLLDAGYDLIYAQGNGNYTFMRKG